MERNPIVVALLVALAGCSTAHELHRSVVAPAQIETVDRRLPYLKAHLRDGSVVLLSHWSVDSVARAITGDGERLDVNRRSLGPAARLSIALDSVALFETNVARPHRAVAAMGVITGVSAMITLACLTNPKACFGSCPTFYADTGGGERLVAESFSASVAPSLEATDVDALYDARPSSRRYGIRMTNEALETHVVRSVRLLAVPRPQSGRVYATQHGDFWQTNDARPPVACRAAEGDCLTALSRVDGIERFSKADSSDLAERETIELDFAEMPTDGAGLVIASRQTLLSTYLLYQALAYMGRSAGSWLAALQRGDLRTREQAQGAARVLGGIEVQVEDDAGTWKTVGETQETGPLATDVRVVPLPSLPAGTSRLRLRLTKGHWRIDGVTIVRLTNRVLPVRLDPVSVRRAGQTDTMALAQLRDSTQSLVTFPGDEYTLVFDLPVDYERHDLFLEARGYYLEWMRQEWLSEENLFRAAALFADPRGAMRTMAPEFKRHEPQMEALFWGSRYVRRN